MSHYFHYLLIALGLALNHRDRPALALTVVVGLSAVLPVNAFVSTAGQFYLFCGLVETLVALVGLQTRTVMGQYIAITCACLVALHFLGWHLNGWLTYSPYRVLVKIAEYAELVACVTLSKPFSGLFKK